MSDTVLQETRDGVTLNPKVTLSESSASGIAPSFTREGFPRPKRVTLIGEGAYRDCLVGPRSAREYGVPVTGSELPESLELESGQLPRNQAVEVLDRGLLINNLWYSNFSDPDACRITGMTRFACLWVENGQVVAPLNVMRFDETLYNILGARLIALSEQREHIFDTSTYERRSEASALLPGALVEAFTLTL